VAETFDSFLVGCHGCGVAFHGDLLRKSPNGPPGVGKIVTRTCPACGESDCIKWTKLQTGRVALFTPRIA
jgi:hypothetical protein